MSAPDFAPGALGDARRALYSKLVPLLASEGEGRVQPYDDAYPTTPCITIGSPRLGTRSVGSPAANVTTATFPVNIRVDGSKLAQLQKLDELVIAVWRAGGSLGGRLNRPLASTPSSSDITGGGTSSTRTQTVDVEIGIDPIAWCPPAPEEGQP